MTPTPSSDPFKNPLFEDPSIRLLSDLDKSLFKSILNNNAYGANCFLASGARAYCLNENGVSPLRSAMRVRQDEIMRALIKAGAPLNEVWGDSRDADTTVLTFAISKGGEGQAVALFEVGAPIEPPPSSSKSALYDAILHQMPTLVKKMIQRHPSLLSQSPPFGVDTGADYLHIACVCQQPEIIEMILDSGLSVIREPHLAPFLHSVINGLLKPRDDKALGACVNLLIRAGAEINQFFDIEGQRMTPLMLAAQNGLIVTVKTLLDFGADCALTADPASSPWATAAHFASNSEVSALIRERSIPQREARELELSAAPAPERGSVSRARI